ncbi:site-specific integrase, partial [Klebsiella pneumoniae]|uniref:site-specific integrase n=1 Tax=Klebsiella pneumoniae TaxID=573 RepID=UPI003B5A852A
MKQKTLINYINKIKTIKKNLPNTPLKNITTKKITTILNKYINKNKTTSTKLIKSTLNNTFQKTITKNHITTNHITTT